MTSTRWSLMLGGLLLSAVYAQTAPPVGATGRTQAPKRPLSAIRKMPAVQKKRVIVLTDIEADADDSQSMVRLMLYTNDIDIEGLIATTSTFQRERVAPESIQKIVVAYGKARPNLLLHDKAYPPVEQLLSKIKRGKTIYGMQGVGETMDSEGSNWIISVLEKPDPRPVWIPIWGGPNTLAQALFRIRASKTPEQAEKLYAKLRVNAIGDQDDSGPWIRKNFPTVFFIRGGTGGFLGAAPGSNTEVIGDAWIAHNIQEGHGPLGQEYPDTAYGTEGDTPSYLGLIPNGLDEMEHPNWGGWGGRFELFLAPPAVGRGGGRGASGGARGAAGASGAFGGGGGGGFVTYYGGTPEPETHPTWNAAEDVYVPSRLVRGGGRGTPEEFTGTAVTMWRWRVDYQNDFVARMLWTTKPYKEANHPPVPVLNMPDQITVKSGDIFKLDADGSWDPDGDSLSYSWFQYPEAGTYKQLIRFGGANGNGTLSPVLYNVHTIVAPAVTTPQTAHFILRLTDKGTPPLSRYKRVIVTIVPK